MPRYSETNPDNPRTLLERIAHKYFKDESTKSLLRGMAARGIRSHEPEELDEEIPELNDA